MRRKIEELGNRKFERNMIRILTKRNLLIDRNSLQLGNLIGEGNFSYVREALLIRGNERSRLALKILKNGNYLNSNHKFYLNLKLYHETLKFFINH